MDIDKLLKIDRDTRTDPSLREKDIFYLKDLKYHQYANTCPTITKDLDIFKKTKQRTKFTDKEFSSRFFKKYPVFSAVTWEGILIAGGSIGSILNDYEPDDIDIFVYAESKSEKEGMEKANSILRNFLQSIEDYEHKFSSKYTSNIDYIRSKNVLTISGLRSIRINIQIIFRLYSSISEILHGFDMGSSAVGFDGQKVYFTSLSKFSYENNCNIIDTTRRSSTYEKRLNKYLNRGFDILMPDFDMSKATTNMISRYGLNEVLEFPNFVVIYDEVQQNIIQSKGFFFPKKDRVESDYGSVSRIDMGEYALFYRNLYNIIRGNVDNLIFVPKKIDDVLLSNFEHFKSKVEYFYHLLEKSIQGSKFPTSMVEKYITVVHPEEVFSNRNKPKKIINKQIKYVLSLMSNSTIHPVQWMTKNPGTQLTSSYNPIIEDPELWYGKYYLKS